MSISRIYAVFLRPVFLIKSNPTRLVSMFLWIIMDVILWGFITKYLSSLGKDTLSFVNIILGAIILWGFTTRIEHGVMTTFLEDIWSRNLINYFASLLKIDEYICGLVVTSIAKQHGQYKSNSRQRETSLTNEPTHQPMKEPTAELFSANGMDAKQIRQLEPLLSGYKLNNGNCL